MAPFRRLGLVLLAVVAAVGLRAASAAAPGPAAAPAPAAVSPPPGQPDMALGKADAKVTVIEYASAACPHCARFNNEVFPDFKKKYVDTGKVRYVYREMLTDPVQFAATAFMMARCSGDRYFDVLDDVYHQQTEIYDSGDLPGGLLKIGAKYGMDRNKLNSCMDKASIDALNARLDVAAKAGIDATPTFIIGDKKIQGEKTLAELSAVIDPLLAK